MIQDNDGDCFVCHKRTHSLSCNPSEWCIFLPHIDGQTKHRYYHIKCLYPILTQSVTRERFRSLMCEYVPSIAEDSGLPEWTQGELDKAYDDLVLRKGIWTKIDGEK